MNTPAGDGPPPGCTADELTTAGHRLGRQLPTPLRALYSITNGFYNADGQWWVVWPLERAISENLRAWQDGSLDATLIAFGDDGTGSPFCLPVDADADGVVVRWSWIDQAAGEPEGPINDFLARWVHQGRP